MKKVEPVAGRTRLWIVTVVLWNLLTAQASAELQRWPLPQCLEYALAHSIDIQEAATEIRIAESKLAQAKAGRLPQVKFTSINGIVNAARGNAIQGDTDDDDLGPFTRNELEVVQPLFSFGRLRAEIRAAAKGVEVRRAATEKARQETLFKVKELYYNLLLSRQIHELLKEVQEGFTKAVETAEKRLESGEGKVTQQDILKLRIGLSGVNREVFSLERAIVTARLALLRQLGLPLDADVDIADTRLEPVTLHLRPLAQYLEHAGVHRPEIVQVEAAVAARQSRLEAARSAYFPSFFLSGGIRHAEAPNRDDQDNPFVRDDFNYFNAGMVVGARWQLDFWMTHARFAERLAEREQVEIQQQKALSGIALEIQQRYLEVQETQQAIDEAQNARKAARALLVTTLTNFDLGIGEGKDVFEALGLYAKIVGDYYTVVRNYNIATARLTQATGQETTELASQR